MTDNKNTILNMLMYPLVFIITSIIIEMGTFITLDFNILPQYFLLELLVLLILASLIFVTSNKIAQFVLAIVFLLLQSILSYVNITLYSIYGDLFSFDLIVLGAEAFSVFDSSFIKWKFILFLVFVFAISITYMAINLKHKISYQFKSKTALIVLSVFIGIQGLSYGGYFIQKALFKQNNDTLYQTYFENDKTMYDKQFIKSESLRKFGTYPYYIKNLTNMMFGVDDYKQYDKIKDYVKNKVYQTNSNTGLLQNDNVIIVMCESLEWYAINPVLTPNLYNIFNNGYGFDNYYSKSKTNYSEMDVILGSVPTDNAFTNSWHGSTSSLLGNELTFTLPNKFKNAGYESIKYFHDNTGDFYARNKTHTTFGFDDIVTLEDMDIESKAEGLIGHNSSYTRDSDMFESCKEIIAPKDKSYFSFITTITSHGPYNESHKLTDNYTLLDNGKLDEYKNWLESNTNYTFPTDKKYKTYLRNYLATTMDLDKGIGILVDYLKENNLYDNTTLVVYGDHNAYYHDLSYTMRDTKKEDFRNIELYRVPAVIYSNKLGKGNVTQFSCPYNLAPTLLDLTGITYNNNLYMGYSVFNDNFKDTVFVSQIGGIFASDIYSDNVIQIYSDKDLTDEEINKFRENATTFYNKQFNMNLVYNSNIFNKFPELKAYC
ncbi:MAG: LTA synthase family protein [Firmicutes bacterium]|nr:LTA synthase family protein [Bacillota bacterium]